jgi:hypothetical protein
MLSGVAAGLHTAGGTVIFRLHQALARARRGDIEAARADYAAALAQVRGDGVPVFLHLQMLAPLGEPVVAEFRREALRQGADVSRAYAVAGVPVPTALREYRQLFAEGTANARMLTHYARLLSRAGEAAALQSLMNVPELLEISRPAGADVQALRNWFLQHLHLAEPLDRRLAAVATRRFADLSQFAEPLLADLRAMLTREVRRYLERISASLSDHPMRRWLPQDFTLEIFAHHSDGTGHHLPHTHSRGWITGVYYLACDFGPEAAADVGALHLCPDPLGDVACTGWPQHLIPAEAGKLLLMPSYYTHRTDPAGRSGTRLAVPFDVVDVRSAAGESEAA